MRPTLQDIEAALSAAFPGAAIGLTDDSHLHAGHAGAQGGAGHYSVRIVSPRFAGLGRVARHRLVYDPLSSWMPHRIHALAITALAPDEAGTPPHPTSAP
jgi:BolA protein